MKVLIIKTSSLGDIIQAFPVLQYLRKTYPHAQLDWVVEHPFIDLVQSHPYVHQVLTIQTKKWRKNLFKKDNLQEIKQFYTCLRNKRYDIVVDLQGNIKSGLITAFSKSPLKVGFGYSTASEWLNIIFTNRRYNPPIGKNAREECLFLVQSVLGDFRQEESAVSLKISEAEKNKISTLLSSSILKENKFKIMVCPGSNWPNKQLTTKTLKAFLEYLYHHFQPNFLFIWGSDQEKLVTEELTQLFPEDSLMLDKLSLPSLQNFMNHMHLVIAMDSLPLHLAGTTLTPTYSIFGPSSSHKYKPYGIKHEAFQGKCPYHKQFERRCPILRTCTTGGCMKEIEGLTLFNHFIKWWETLSIKTLDK
jgi:heptosyltransferase-1